MTNEELYKQAIEQGTTRPGLVGDFFVKHGYIPGAPGMETYANTHGVDHAGLFSTNNPYLLNLRNAVGADKDALYELAVKWEADYAALQEQREYDSPVEQVRRQREAGINPDIAGSSAGSSVGSSAGSSAQLGDQDNSSSFGDTYKQQELDIAKRDSFANVVNSVTNMATGLVSMAQGITQIIDTSSTISSRKRIAESQAYIAEQTAEDVVSQTRQGTQASILGNIQSRLGILSNLSTLVTPDSTDEDITNTFTSLGIPSDQIPGYISGVREFQKNPNVKAYYEQGEKDKRALEAYNHEYDTSLVGKLISWAADREFCNYQLDLINTDFELSIARVYANYDNASLEAQMRKEGVLSNISDSQTNISNNVLLRKQIEHDTNAFVQQLQLVADAIEESRNTVSRITRQAIFGKTTAEQQSIIDVERIKQRDLMALGSQHLSMARDYMVHSVMNRYQGDRILTPLGVMPNALTKPHITFMQNTFSFSDLVSGRCTADDLTSDLVKVCTGFALGVK